MVEQPHWRGPNLDPGMNPKLQVTKPEYFDGKGAQKRETQNRHGIIDFSARFVFWGLKILYSRMYFEVHSEAYLVHAHNLIRY